MKIQSCSSKKEKQSEKAVPVIQVSGLSQSDLQQPSSTKSLDQNRGGSIQQISSPQSS